MSTRDALIITVTLTFAGLAVTWQILRAWHAEQQAARAARERGDNA